MKGQLWVEGGEDFHRAIVQPTLLLHGEDDKLEPAEATMEMHQVRKLVIAIHVVSCTMRKHPN